MQRASRKDCGWRVSPLGLVCLLVLASHFQQSTAQICPDGCQECSPTWHSFQVRCEGLGLTSFPQLPLSAQRSVQIMALSNNAIQVIEPNALENYTSLRYIQLNFNQLREIPSGFFRNTPHLNRVSLIGNQLRELPSDLFNTTYQISDLNLSENLLETLPDGLFSEMRNLRNVYLDANRLTKLPRNLFSDTNSLFYFYLHDNQLTGLPEGILKGTGTLTRLVLEGNHLICDCKVLWLKTLPRNIPNSIMCTAPTHLNGQVLTSVPDDQLVCECNPPCIHGICNLTLGVCQCDGGLECCKETYPVQQINQSASSMECPDESTVRNSISANIRDKVRNAIVPFLQGKARSCQGPGN